MTNSKQYIIYLMFVTTWSKKLKNMLSFKKTQMAKDHMIIFIWHLQNIQIQRDWT